MNEHNITLGQDWQGERIAGWFMSEKFDGCRAYWDGEALWSRSGRKIEAPAWFTAGLPAIPLDGEIWSGRGQLNAAVQAVNRGRFTTQTGFMIFDSPSCPGDWQARMQHAARHINGNPHVQTVAVKRCASERAMLEELSRVTAVGGEGLMLRNPKVLKYEARRTRNLLKVKPGGAVYSAMSCNGLLKIIPKEKAA